MFEVVKVAGFVAGLFLVLSTWASIVNTVITPRPVASRITYWNWQIIRGAFMYVANRCPTYERKDRVLALLGPASLLMMLLTWVLLFLVGFALMFWPFGDGDFGTALRLSGSSLFTLGVASSPQGGPTALEFAGAATGMIVVALQIGYLPTIYGAYNRRETLVTALRSRAGEPAWGPEILARHQMVGGLPTLAALFSAWELWAADITESHASYPWLMVFRSPGLLHSWVISQLAIMDAAALYLALSPEAAPPETRQCLRTGFVGFQTLAAVIDKPVDPDPRPDAPIDLPYTRFVHGVELLQETGFPIERSIEEAWRHFRGWRVNYEAAAYALADFVVAVPAPWSGHRKYMTKQEVFDVLSRRPVNRSPDRPDGAETALSRMFYQGRMKPHPVDSPPPAAEPQPRQ